MKTRFQNYAAAAMAAVMLLTGTSMPASAEDVTKIVVLGDSISTGAGLSDQKQSYVNLVADNLGATVQNFAQDAYTTQDVLDCLEDTQVQQALSEADMILVTVGIHDIMDPFLDEANALKEKYGFEKFMDVFTAQLEDYGLTEDELSGYATDLKAAAALNRDSAAANMLTIAEELAVYTNAEIVYQTVYNSMNTIEIYDQLSSKRKMAYRTITNAVTIPLNDETSTTQSSINKSLRQIATQYDCTLVDTYTAFETLAYQYCNLTELDVNPTSLGHSVIAAEILAASGSLKKGDVNADGSVNAKDASWILVHAAKVAAGSDPMLGAAQETAGDVNGDNAPNAADASKVLIYAADEAAGKQPSWD